MNKKTKYAIIVAGGVGSRSGDSLPKQFHMLGGHPMLWWTLKAFHDEDPETRIIVVMHPDFIGYWEEIKGEDCIPHRVTSGGRTRTDSVAAGLALIKDDSDALVAVHDAARPLASENLIRRGWECAEEKAAAIPAISVSDSLREGTREDSHSVDRSRYFAVQTPQIFDCRLLKEAYAAAMDDKSATFTDDASVIEWFGRQVFLYEGDPINIKVTYPGDFLTAETILLPDNR